MTTLEQSMARDKQRVTLAKWFIILLVLWFAFIGGLAILKVPMENLGFFSLGTVTGSLMTILALIFQFFFRASGDKVEPTEGILKDLETKLNEAINKGG